MADTNTEHHPRKRIKLYESEASAPANGNLLPHQDEDEHRRKELKAGITFYVNPNTPGFTGTLKQRYTDFLVNEVTLSGEVLHLQSTKLPARKSDKAPKPQPVAPEILNAAQDTSVTNVEQAKLTDGTKQKNEHVAKQSEDGQAVGETTFKLSQAEQDELEDFFGDECVKAILRLYSKVLESPDRKPREFRSINTWPMDDKSKRGRAHGALRRIFKGTLESTHGEGNIIVISKSAAGAKGADGKKWSRNDAGNDRGKGKLGWDDLGGEYLHFTLHKENKDTMEVISFIGSQLRCAPKNFQFAGTKDRRAVTVQRVSCYRQHAHQLAGLNKMFRGSRVGDFKYEQYPLELGALWGNEFVISLRDCHFPGEEGMSLPDRLELGKKVVGDAVSRLQESGFVNYYGLQRFGSFMAGTDDIGMKLLQGDFEGAVNLILDFHPSALEAAKEDDTTAKISSDDRSRALGLDIWKRTNDAKKALEYIPRKFSAETNIIRHLGVERGGKKTNLRDFQGAMLAIPRNLRLMYVHAYQSLVWNTIVGKRWKAHGDKVTAGDLVIIGDKKDAAKDEEEVDEDGEPIVRPGVADSSATEGDFTRARALNTEEAASGKYDIFDIVLPLPGWDVVYPPNEIGEAYKEFMGSATGGGLDPMDMRRKWKDYSLSGGYRKILSRPAEGMSSEVRTYREETQQLVETDLERLDRLEGKAKENGEDCKMEDGEEKQEDKYIAAVLRMKLGASQYATMALRELLKRGGVQSFKAEFSGRGN